MQISVPVLSIITYHSCCNIESDWALQIPIEIQIIASENISTFCEQQFVTENIHLTHCLK